MSKIPVITIDGASGTGKGVVTQQIAKNLGWHLLDSGVLYRALAYAAQKHQISLTDEAALVALASALDIKFIFKHISELPILLLEDEVVTDIVRTEAIGNAASKVGTLSLVRQALLKRQRDFRTPPGLVTDGRDMGTVVFPDADLKIFLTASALQRAYRRHNQLKALGFHGNLDALVLELEERDKRDQERTIAPLKPAADAILIDTDHLTIEQVVEKVMAFVQKKGLNGKI